MFGNANGLAQAKLFSYLAACSCEKGSYPTLLSQTHISPPGFQHDLSAFFSYSF